jgi:hypothetical protein
MKLVVITGDSRISRIDKLFGENSQKFIDLYASIYGTRFPILSYIVLEKWFRNQCLVGIVKSVLYTGNYYLSG